jgi:hypothetical protein
MLRGDEISVFPNINQCRVNMHTKQPTTTASGSGNAKEETEVICVLIDLW